MTLDLTKIPCFGVAGNFTGHLEQAGEAESFKDVKTESEEAPKAIFPTYIPSSSKIVPDFLKTFPFSWEKIAFPSGIEGEYVDYSSFNLQIESECALVFDVIWEEGRVKDLKPVCFGASNDCSIRKEGNVKISTKKNWGKCSKGFSSNLIELDDFTENSIISKYRIKSFLVRDGLIHEYGEDSKIANYSYIYGRLVSWIIKTINTQKDEKSMENILSYLASCNYPEKIMISIGATRYTDYGNTHLLQKNDRLVVALYPEGKYSAEEVTDFSLREDFSCSDISFLSQKVE